LPPLRDPRDENRDEVIHQTLRDALAYSQALVDAPQRWLLSADLFTMNPWANPETVKALAWTREAYKSVSERHRSTVPRHIHLPQLIDAIFQDPDKSKSLVKLADLGFPDALRAPDILDLAQRYGGLDKGTPSRLLGKMEWLARAPRHSSGNLARLRIVGTYAKAIWQVFAAVDRTAAEKDMLTTSLLHRAEDIDQAAGSNMLDLLLQITALKGTESPRMAFVPGDGDQAVLSTESLVGQLWRVLSTWAGTDGRRRAAYGRAIREAWRALDEHRPEGPSRVEYAPLLLAMGTVFGPESTISLVTPEIEAVAILSAGWKERPLAGLSVPPLSEDLEGILKRGVALLENGRGNEIAGDVGTWTYTLGDDGESARIRAFVPPE